MENAIRQLLEEAGKILADRKQETQSGKCFNCIDICGVGTIETRHTEIIAALLDPQGNHGFGAESLKAFFRACGLTEFSDHCEDCCVRTEVKIPGRRPDIVISGKDLCVVIENKTNTSDHYMQLADYRDWVQKQKATYKALLYLTYEGYNASDKYIADKEYECISYTKTICNWLQECAGMKSDPAADFCKQYAKFIKNTIMGDGTVNNNMTETILADVESFKAAACINQSFAKAKSACLTQCVKECCKKDIVKVNTNSIWIEYPGNKPYHIGFQWDSKCCYYGIARNERTPDFEKCRLDGFQSATDWWIAYKYAEKGFNCDWLDSEFLSAQWEKDNFDSFKKFISECITEVKNVISQNPEIK
jgi:hypothetical protein